MAQSLKSKGYVCLIVLLWLKTISWRLVWCCFCRYLRAQNAYNPPENVQGIVDALKSTSNIKSGCDGTKFNLDDKFTFLSICAEKFQHTVPNSMLHEINVIGNVGTSLSMKWIIFDSMLFVVVHFVSLQMMLSNFMRRQSIHFYHWTNYVWESYRQICILSTITHVSIPRQTQCLVEKVRSPNFHASLPALSIAKNILVLWLNADAKK